MPGSSSYHHSHWHVRCVSVPGPDTDLTLYVNFGATRFVFGCGEGTQRAFIQKKIGLKGLAAIFLGSGDQTSRAGLPGMLMTAADAGIKEVNIVGPPDTNHFISTMRSSVQRDGLKVITRPFPLDIPLGKAYEIYQSPVCTVHAVALRPQSPVSGPSEDTPSTTDLRSDASKDFDPFPRSFNTHKLTPRQLRRWTAAIVQDCFGNRARVPNATGTIPPSALGHPLVRDGIFRPGRAHVRYHLPRVAREDALTEMVYICQAPDVAGKFDVEKATALGVPKGPARGKLVKGESLEVDDKSAPGGKRIVRPQDCLIGGGPGSVLIVINCSERNLDTLLQSDAFDQYQGQDHSDKKHVHAVLHRVPSTVWSDERYQAWIQSFGPQTHHLVADSHNVSQDTFFRSAAWNTLQLSIADPELFSPPYSSAVPSIVAPSSQVNIMVPDMEVRMHKPQPPSVENHHSKDRPFPWKHEELQWAKDVLSREIPEYANACAEARAKVESDPRFGKEDTRPGHDIVVTTLGTGSAIPSKYRNVSSTHLHIPGVGGVLLDCGEGTMGQLRRRFGPEGVKDVLRDIKLIFISHMHADHHLGLQTILREKLLLDFEGPLYVVGPTHIAMSMKESTSWQVDIDQAILDRIVFVGNIRPADSPPSSPSPPSDITETSPPNPFASGWPNSDLLKGGPGATERCGESIESICQTLGLKSLSTPLVHHRGRAFGLVLEHESGWKVVYSGDTMPCNSLAAAGENATLLIHEATLEDDKPDVAAQKGHSTFSQAIDMGKRMNASHVLLNHFSQRYPKLPVLPAPSTDADEVSPVVSVSFDFMSIRVGDMWKMSYYMDALSILFDDADPEEGDDTSGAVEGDTNPTLDVGVGGGKQSRPEGKKGHSNANGNGNGGGNGTEAPAVLSKRAQRRAEKVSTAKEGREHVRLRGLKKRGTRSPSPVKGGFGKRQKVAEGEVF